MSFDSREYRDALGHFATGICIVTAAPEDEQPFGMTVNSFSSVSLDPPLILWSLQNNSECFASFEKSNTFGVNILASDQQPLSDFYAQKGDHNLEQDHYRLGKTGCPVLRGVLTSLECRIWARYPGGDHTILVGEVIAMEAQPDGQPLIFHKGQYGQIR
jgi:flavin reductase (DIM6/NTAB) family NADH-FMN oxidoreductase RutF